MLARFFTIITNLVARGRDDLRSRSAGELSPLVLGGLTLAILLVGVVYAIAASRACIALSGRSAHRRTSCSTRSRRSLMALWWLLFAPRATLALERALAGGPSIRSPISSTRWRAASSTTAIPIRSSTSASSAGSQTALNAGGHRARLHPRRLRCWSGSTAGVRLGRARGSR